MALLHNTHLPVARASLCAARTLLSAACAVAPVQAQGATLKAGAGSLTGPYIDLRQQTGVAFGLHSHPLQPWRGYQETVRAADFLNASGINLGVPNGMNLDLIYPYLLTLED